MSGEFKGTVGKRQGAIDHHLVFKDIISDSSQRSKLYIELQKVDSRTKRSYFDITN